MPLRAEFHAESSRRVLPVDLGTPRGNGAVTVAVHESGVNFQNLIRDLAEMYPFDVDEVVLTELVANCLDAKAARIAIDFDPRSGMLVVEDNGRGMTPSEFAGYHDFAAELKPRGTGIGFAGVGSKVSFRIADRVITETRSKSFSAGSNWYLEGGKRLVWEEVPPERLQGTGTRVEIHFGQARPRSYESREDLVRLLKRYYLPLLDRSFLELYDRLKVYSKDLTFIINGEALEPLDLAADLGLQNVREFYPARRRKRYGYGILGLADEEYPLAPDLCGVLVCTYGKVVKADLFNQFPGSYGPRVFGLVEVPVLVQFLTTTKTEFLKQGRQKQFEELYDPIRQEFRDWLKGLGIEPPETSNAGEAGKLERELKKIVEDVPELGEFFGFKVQRTLFHGTGEGVRAGAAPREEAPDAGAFQEASQETGGDEESDAEDAGSGEAPPPPRISLVAPDEPGSKRGSPVSRSGRKGPKIAFVKAPDRPEMAWVEGNNVVINTGHPSYVKVAGNAQARTLHNLFAIGGAVQRYLSSNEAPDLTFVDRMMRAWGSR